jgi:SET domain-containing protein
MKTLDKNLLNIFIDKCSFGRGVFAAENIAKGEVILTFSGRTITLDEALAKEGEKSGNPLQIDTKKYVDIEEPGVIVNHHCNPNAGIINTYTLVALIDICKGEQIFYDYSTTMSDNLWTMECGCSAINCRKIVKDFHYLPASVKEKYLKLGIVQEFIVKEHQLISKINFNEVN